MTCTLEHNKAMKAPIKRKFLNQKHYYCELDNYGIRIAQLNKFSMSLMHSVVVNLIDEEFH